MPRDDSFTGSSFGFGGQMSARPVSGHSPRFSQTDAVANRDDRAASTSSTVPIKQSALVQKLTAICHLGAGEIETLEALSHNAKQVGPEQILIHEGSSSDFIYLFVSGLACRYKMLAGGRRQILGYLVPGDLCDVHYAVASRPDYSVCTVGNSWVARVPTWQITEMMMNYPTISRAFARLSQMDAVILREWLLNVGQRDALQKLCHLFCEMAVRLEAVGRTNDDGSFDLPLKQTTLADTLGLSTVHVNRTLQRLRVAGLIKFCHRRLVILDYAHLAAIAEFSPAYLKLSYEGPLGSCDTRLKAGCT